MPRYAIALLLTVLFAVPPALAAEPVLLPPENSPVSATLSSDTEAVIPPQASETEQADLWQRLRAGLALPDLDTTLVGVHENWFASHPSYLQRAIERSRPYLFHIVEELDKRHMPMEIALLPIIESAYNPQAQSPQQASGIWQFIPSTGKVFGLKQNGWYDGRRDVVTATQAALDYLQKLQRQFGRWELALAAYNCGEGCVARAIQRNRARGLGEDYLNLDLPTETRHYVPKLLAVRHAIQRPARFGLALDSLANTPYFRQVSLSYPIEAKTAARLADMSQDEFLALNPGFRRRVIHADSQNTLLLPIDKADTFQTNLAETESRQIRLHPYSARKGEFLSRIAERFDVTVQWLQDHNPLALKRGKLAQAQTLLLPAAKTATLGISPPADTPAQKVAMATPEKTKAAGKAAGKAKKAPIMRGHLVRRGETLAKLASRYKVTVAELREYNRPIKTLRPGDILLIPING